MTQIANQARNEMQIDHNAPLTSHKEVFIPASPETVWQLHTDINHWADWRSDVSSATLGGLLKPGSVFIWKTPGVTITSTLQEVETNRRISWTGTGLGTTAAHIWTLEARDDGTLVVTEESMSGWVPRVMKFFIPGFLDKSLDVWLGDMKKRLQLHPTE
jgi:uncharacterized protein YndB with AHSA1/START domain